MPLHELRATQFRNLRDVRIDLDPELQFVSGDNASGKTSLLDAIHVLCSAKSFLGASPRKLQQHHTTGFSLSGSVSQQGAPARPMQYRWQDDNIRLFISNEQVRRASDYANLQPVRAITPLSYGLIDGAPGGRRQFIDWGVFHMKHEYADVWRKFQRALAQRNATLAADARRQSMSVWNQQFTQLANTINEYRATYIALYAPKAQRFFQTLLPQSSIGIKYHRGWDTTRELDAVLDENFQHDLDRRFTYYGPQRAELALKLDETPARDSASRGQKKLITLALYLAQAALQQDIGRHSGIFLLDDLPSELDRGHVGIAMELLRQIRMQVIISCIDITQIPKPHRSVRRMFHVKHGAVHDTTK